MKKYVVISSFFIFCALGCLYAFSNTFVRESEKPSQLPETVSLTFDKWLPSKNKDYRMFCVRLDNFTSQDIGFVGYDESSPWYKIQKWDGKKWIEHNVGWFCGTGLRNCTIASEKSSVIGVHVDEKIFPLRVGVDYSQGSNKKGSKKKIVWSEKIVLE